MADTIETDARRFIMRHKVLCQFHEFCATAKKHFNATETVAEHMSDPESDDEWVVLVVALPDEFDMGCYQNFILKTLDMFPAYTRGLFRLCLTGDPNV